MPETGYFAQKRNSPTSLGLVILLHAALITAVVLIKSPAFTHALNRTVIDFIPNVEDPPVDPPPPPQHQQPQHPPENIDHVAPQTDMNIPGPTVDTSHDNVVIASNDTGTSTVDIPRLPPPEPAALPVRRAAQIDSSSRLQPPYPPSELRLNRDGRVQVRVTIGPDGRVTDVALISATSDAFWLVTRQQALRYWRFRPATVDGRAVQETRTMSLVFRIEDQG
jgi:protein TonB